MQTKKWVRLGLMTVVVGGMVGGAALAGCSGDDNNGSSGGHDAGGDHTTTGDSGGGGLDSGHDSQPADTGTGPDGSDAGKVPNAKVYLVHAAVDPLAPPYRFCFGVANSPDGGGGISVPSGIVIDAFPDFKISPSFPVAGLFPGFGGSTASSPQLDIDLSSLNVALYAIDATHIATNTADGGPDGGAEVPCSGLIGTDAQGTGGAKSGSLTPGTDYWYLGTIPSGTLTHGSTWVAAVTGCAPGETGAAAALCGPNYSATNGNLGVVSWQLDNTTVIDGGLGAQFANASPQWDGVGTQASAAGTVAGFWTLTTPEAGTAEAGSEDGGDAGDAAPVEAGPPAAVFTPIIIAGPPNTAFPKITSPAVAVPPPFSGYDLASGFFAAYVNASQQLVNVPAGCTPGVSCVSPTALPLPIIDQYTNGAVGDGGNFAPNTTVAFVLIGDPSGAELPYIGADGGQTDNPTNPPVPNGKFPHFLAFPSHNP